MNRKFKKDNKVININRLKSRFFVFDVETTKLEPMAKNFVFGVIYGYYFKKVLYSVEDFKKEFSRKKYKGKYIFAHNAEFDLMTVYGNIYQNLDTSAIFNGSFISANKDGVTFADSMNIFARMSVKRIGEMIGLEKIENTKVKTEGLTKKNLTFEDIEYCIRDCEIIHKALLKMFEGVGNIKVTLPSLALWDYRHNYLTEDFYFSDNVYEFYSSYYGGRCEAFRLGKVCADVYDINSMYPYAMKNTLFPDVRNLKKETGITVECLIHLMKHFEGLASIKVIHKNTFFGYLPCKTKVNKHEKLVFPVGIFETTVNFNELRFALEAGVIEILKVHYVVYGLPVESPFIKYIDTIYELKENATDNLNRTIYKLRMNALYGKFGQKTKYNTTYFPDFPYELIKKYEAENVKYEIKPFSLKRNDCFLVVENKNPEPSFYSIPVYASYITSEARVLLLKHLLLNEKNNVCYCDTDSLFIEGSFTGSVGEGLGEFKKEEKKVIEINGLKNYRYINEKGTEFQKLKGIPRNAKKEIISTFGKSGGEVYHIKKYYKTLQALRQSREAGEAYELIKTVTGNYDKRLVNIAGETRPLKMPLPDENKKFNDFEPGSYYEAILKFFVTGGKVKRKDVIDNVTGKSKDIKFYKNITDEKGLSMDVFNDYVPEALAVGYPIEHFIEVLNKFHTVTGMKKELKRLLPPDESNIKQFSIFEDMTIPF